jgi:Domain of unknown function (DUF2760)
LAPSFGRWLKPTVVPPKAPDFRPVLFLLTLLQREGRLIDFVQEDIAQFSDAEVGSAARLVHAGCKKVLSGWIDVRPILTVPEGQRYQAAAGTLAGQLQLVGNPKSNQPIEGVVKHQGWRAEKVTIGNLPNGVDLAVLAPAEVEVP